MKSTLRPSVSLVSETGMFLRMPSLLISGGPLLNLLCSVEFVIATSCWWAGVLMCETVGKADLLLDHFENKQSRETVDLLLTCHSSQSLITFAF